jgi:hypothetical protein
MELVASMGDRKRAYRVLMGIPEGNSGSSSSVGIVTGYGMDGPRSNPGVGEIFCTRPERSRGPPSLLYNGYRFFPGGKKAGAWC